MVIYGTPIGNKSLKKLLVAQASIFFFFFFVHRHQQPSEFFIKSKNLYRLTGSPYNIIIVCYQYQYSVCMVNFFSR